MRLDDALRPLGGGAMRLAIAQSCCTRLRVYVVATPSRALFSIVRTYCTTTRCGSAMLRAIHPRISTVGIRRAEHWFVSELCSLASGHAGSNGAAVGRCMFFTGASVALADCGYAEVLERAFRNATGVS